MTTSIVDATLLIMLVICGVAGLHLLNAVCDRLDRDGWGELWRDLRKGVMHLIVTTKTRRRG